MVSVAAVYHTDFAVARTMWSTTKFPVLCNNLLCKNTQKYHETQHFCQSNSPHKLKYRFDETGCVEKTGYLVLDHLNKGRYINPYLSLDTISLTILIILLHTVSLNNPYLTY